MLIANKKSAELTEPRIGSLHDPTAFVASHLAPVCITPPLVVPPVRWDQLNGSFFQPLTQRIGVVTGISDHPFRLLSRPAFGSWDAGFFECGLCKRNFYQRAAFQLNSQRKTLTVDQYHPLRFLAALGFTDRITPFFAGVKLRFRNVSSHFNRPLASNAPNRARHASRRTPSSCHCFSRQQVAGEGSSPRRNRHAAPVYKICRMDSKQGRFDAHGRPRLSFRCPGSGNNGPIRSHCSSVISFCRFFMTEVQQPTYFRRKYLP